MHGRDFKWQQGDVLNKESAKKLDLINVSESDSLPVVITHNCDLLHPNEENVEVIIGKKVVRPKSMYAYAKHMRYLHLQFTSSVNQNPVYSELRFSNR